MTDKKADKTPTRMEERLYQNRYQVDEGNPHVSINPLPAGDSPALKSLTEICPAGCYRTGEEIAQWSQLPDLERLAIMNEVLPAREATRT